MIKTPVQGLEMTDERDNRAGFDENGFLDREAREFPRIVNVNVWRGSCPCRCVHCPVGMTPPEARSARFGQGGISLGLFEKIVDEIACKSPESVLRIHSVGEPLLWGELSAAVRYAHARGIRTWIFTSAVTRDWELLETLCRCVSIVEVSVNSTTRDDYAKTKGIDSFDAVCEAIDRMAAHIRDEGLPARLLVSRVQSPSRELDEAFPRYWLQKPGIADAFVRSYHNYNGIIGEDRKDGTLTPCLVHWGRFNIDTDGTAVVCFNELFRERLEPDVLLGNVAEQTIESIWKSEKLNAIRRFSLGLDKSCGCTIPCMNCTFCQKYPPHAFTSERQLRTLDGNTKAAE